MDISGKKMFFVLTAMVAIGVVTAIAYSHIELVFNSNSGEIVVRLER